MNCAVDAWSVTVARLGDGTVNKRVDEQGSALNGFSALRWEESARMPIPRVLEKPAAHTLIVSWCDARFGHYGYQTWRAAVARVPGSVLTGRPIEVGDSIFKPRPVAQTPANADAMICAKGVNMSKQPT